MPTDLELNERLLVQDPAASSPAEPSDTEPEARSEKDTRGKRISAFSSFSDHIVSDTGGDGCNGGLICVMFCMVLFMLVLMFLFGYAVMVAYGAFGYVQEMLDILSNTIIDFPVTPTENIDHYHGILSVGGPPTDYECHYQGDTMLADCPNKNGDDAAIMFTENGPIYFFTPKGYGHIQEGGGGGKDVKKVPSVTDSIRSLMEMKLPAFALESRLEDLQQKVRDHQRLQTIDLSTKTQPEEEYN